MRSIFVVALLEAALPRPAPAPTAPASRPDRVVYVEARDAEARLHASKVLEARRAEWDRVAQRYRKVVSLYPQSDYCPDALLAEGDLLRAMAVRFKAPKYNDDAVSTYKSVVSGYPSSGLGEKALFAVFEIARDSGDRKRIADAAKAYLDTFPDRPRGAVVRVALAQAVPEGVASMPSPPPPGLAQVFNLRFWTGDSSTRVVIDLEKEVRIQHDRISGPDRLWIDLIGTRLHPNLTDRTFPVGDGLLDRIRIAQNKADVVRVVLDFKKVKDHSVVYMHDPTRLVIDVRGDARTPATEPTKVAAERAAGTVETPAQSALDRAAQVEAVDLPAGRPRAAGPPSPAPSPLPEVALAPVAAPSPRPSPAPATPSPPPSGEKGKSDKGRRPAVAAAPSPSPSAPVAALSPSPVPSPVPSPSPTPAAAPSVIPSPAPSPEPLPSAVREARLESSPQPPQANRAGTYSLARQLGLSARRIVIDPGHGGQDPGTIGAGGLQEKDLCLDVSLRLEKMLRGTPGTEVIMTRATDAYVPLEERTAIANSKGADLFLSVHANSSRSPSARGIETYILNFAVDPHAEEVAARENAISPATMKDLQGLVKAIALNSKIDESRDFATSIHESMIAHVKAGQPAIQDRGVRTAPFYVLIGANMPSVLAEISFVSNPDDERLLRSPDYREKIATSLFEGIKRYLDGLNHSAPPPRQLTAAAPASRVVYGGKQGR